MKNILKISVGFKYLVFWFHLKECIKKVGSVFHGKNNSKS